ncbi:four helix bundle protein [Candidatus Peregrinibacteria bacterium]|nr:four helix bundle protein [Candidatus Peregrinibacteria bacterium]MBI3816011.1 four helix bundle protein [Candidatus Peregrinibacteria bacterium]
MDQRQPLPLDQRTRMFAKAIRAFVRQLPPTRITYDDCAQLLRASGSVGANYIEAVDAESKKDFLHRIRICRKEAKESLYWLDLLHDNIAPDQQKRCAELMNECEQLARIFTAIAKTTESRLR